MDLEKKTILLNPGDSKAKVLEVMGPPKDRQFQGDYEVWQYCITGAGFGYHDYRAIWLRNDQVTGITSYKDTTPASRCEGLPEVGPQGYLAVVDESGEDYLYPASFFHTIDLGRSGQAPPRAER